MLPIKERLNNPQVVRVYRQIIENAPIDVVENLRNTLQEKAPDHAKTKVLEEFFVQRLGS
jgi:hypothetical protein